MSCSYSVALSQKIARPVQCNGDAPRELTSLQSSCPGLVESLACAGGRRGEPGERRTSWSRAAWKRNREKSNTKQWGNASRGILVTSAAHALLQVRKHPVRLKYAAVTASAVSRSENVTKWCSATASREEMRRSDESSASSKMKALDAGCPTSKGAEMLECLMHLSNPGTLLHEMHGKTTARANNPD